MRVLRSDEILGTTLKDFRDFAEVLAAVRDQGQVVAVTSGERRWRRAAVLRGEAGLGGGVACTSQPRVDDA